MPFRRPLVCCGRGGVSASPEAPQSPCPLRRSQRAVPTFAEGEGQCPLRDPGTHGFLSQSIGFAKPLLLWRTGDSAAGARSTPAPTEVCPRPLPARRGSELNAHGPPPPWLDRVTARFCITQRSGCRQSGFQSGGTLLSSGTSRS